MICMMFGTRERRKITVKLVIKVSVSVHRIYNIVASESREKIEKDEN